MKVKEIKSKRDALATHFGMDLSETEEYRYHYGRTSQPVWTFDSGYYCVTKGKQKPAKYNHGGNAGWEDWLRWKELPDEFLNRNDYHIWFATEEF